MVKKVCYPDKSKWHRWFAWYPIYIGPTHTETHYCYHKIWWEWVERQVYNSYDGGFCIYRKIEP